ncbi:MAG: PAS domain S-box protein [candidate division Zixibacteria bacterium]|nr:PAS domain S-box protein [candidate division Zixibacteria bacterium]
MGDKVRNAGSKLGWYLPLRLATFVIVFVVVVLWMRNPGFLRDQFVLYSFLTLCFTLLLAFDRRGKLRYAAKLTVALQFLFEISIESGIIYATGNVNSQFSALFILTIVSASLAYRLVGSLLVASLVSFAYAFIIWLGLSSSVDAQFSLDALQTIFIAQDSVFYSIFLHILIFYLVAFISGYLAERLRRQDQELVNTSLALRKARLETDDILRHVNSGLLTLDSRGFVVYFNRAAERILDCREVEVRGLRCQEAFYERMPALVECLENAVDNGLEHPRREIEILARNGTVVPLGLSTSILTEEGHKLRGVIAIFSDLTEAKRLEAKVRTADRLAAIGELSASIAHEIRNPLASISGSVEVLKSELNVSGENERLMSLIVKESHRLSQILTDFLSYARIDRPTYTKVELCHLVAEIIEILYHHESFSDKVDVRFESAESIVYVVGDEGLIKQLLLNLAVNACEAFEGRGGRLAFRLSINRKRGTVELGVDDDGPGMPPEVIKKMYQPFFSTKKEGTGLGLSIVHRICTAMRMGVQLSSQVGEGTSFAIEMKIFAPDLPAPESVAQEPVTQENDVALTARV